MYSTSTQLIQPDLLNLLLNLKLADVNLSCVEAPVRVCELDSVTEKNGVCPVDRYYRYINPRVL